MMHDLDNFIGLDWPNGRVELQALGGMTRSFSIILADGRKVTPLSRAPWVGTADGAGERGLMAGLSCDWLCVPFGAASENLPDAWREIGTGWEDEFPHGFAAHREWELAGDEDGLSAGITFPQSHPIERLERKITPLKNGIACSFGILPRRNCSLPIGLHPVFLLPDVPGRIALEVGGARGVYVHPDDPSPDPTPAKPGAFAADLMCVPALDGGTIDFSKLPLAENSETRLMLPAGGGAVRLRDQQSGIVTTLHYDAEIFPSLMLWVSNRGRRQAPWSGRHLALGVEPVCAAFDLGAHISSNASPLTDKGIKTAHNFIAGQWLRSEYAITVEVE